MWPLCKPRFLRLLHTDVDVVALVALVAPFTLTTTFQYTGKLHVTSGGFEGSKECFRKNISRARSCLETHLYIGMVDPMPVGKRKLASSIGVNIALATPCYSNIAFFAYILTYPIDTCVPLSIKYRVYMCLMLEFACTKTRVIAPLTGGLLLYPPFSSLNIVFCVHCPELFSKLMSDADSMLRC
jgi:hypothetical protein